jgi:hypothetical protein
VQLHNEKVSAYDFSLVPTSISQYLAASDFIELSSIKIFIYHAMNYCLEDLYDDSGAAGPHLKLRLSKKPG